MRRAPAAAATAAAPARPISSARPSHARHRVRSSERSRIQTALTTPPPPTTSCRSLSPHRPAAGKQVSTAITGGTPTTGAEVLFFAADWAILRRGGIPRAALVRRGRGGGRGGPDRQPDRAADQRRVAADDGAGPLQAGQALGQQLQRDPALEPGQRLADAVVDAAGERQVIRAALRG